MTEMLSYDFTTPHPLPAVLAADDGVEGVDPELLEIQVADYVTFLLALDVYMGWLYETTGSISATDDTLQQGLQLLRVAERQNLGAIKTFIQEHLASRASVALLEAACRPPPTPSGASVRALKIRTVLSKGGTATTKAVFGTSIKARREVQEAIEASMIDDPDQALNKFSALVLRNKRLEKWIDRASEVVVPGTATISPVQEATKGATDATTRLLTDRVQEEGNLGTDRSVASRNEQAQTLAAVETAATESAKKAMASADQEDKPITRSEAIGVATAAATAVASDPNNLQNVPACLRSLDPEQRAAALTDGKVLVTAGAGAGKSTTLVARVEYLVKVRGINPSKIFVTSFNTEAANELKHKIGKAVGKDAFDQMSVGTTHSLFKKIISDYGTPAQRIAVGAGGPGQPNGMIGNGVAVASAVNRAWQQCFAGTPNATPPKAKMAMRFKSLWAGNNVTPAMAQAQATEPEEAQCAVWYEWYEGFKGSIPGWRPPCSKTPKDWEVFNAKKRPGGIRLGDFDDMLGIARDILVARPDVRKKIQGVYDHIMVDECQDLNEVQDDIVQAISEHIVEGNGKSLWMVGDDKQSIYAFRGARPDIFTGRDGAPGWKTRMIKTNYRCQPEIVEAANKLIAHNIGQIPMEARPNPDKARGVASIVVQTPVDDADAALTVVEGIKSEIALGGASVSDYAVLTRTNREQHAYETACIIRGIPYARKGTSSFLGSPETKTFLSYVQLITGDDGKKMQEAFKEVINKPNRFFVAPDVGAAAVEAALAQYASLNDIDRKVLNPMAAFGQRSFRQDLARRLTGVDRGFKYDKTVEALDDMFNNLSVLRSASKAGELNTKQVFDEILNLRGKTGVTDPRTGDTKFIEQSFRESLQQASRDAMGDDEDVDDEEDSTKGLGNISFLYQLAQPDPTDPDDMATTPMTPLGFKAKMERMAGRMRDLRIDLDKWKKEQEALPPEERKAPPGVYLGTIHSTKGAQWKNVYVQMPKGKFPFQPPVRPGQEPQDPAVAEAEMETERRLAYVAVTRPKMNLTIVCPAQIGGKAAGVSPFVFEAGLIPGENVASKGVKTASLPEYEGPVPEAWVAPELSSTPSYDRSPS